MKYRVEVESHVTRFCERIITVYAKDEVEACQKAIDKYMDLEAQVIGSYDAGTPTVDSIEMSEGAKNES